MKAIARDPCCSLTYKQSEDSRPVLEPDCLIPAANFSSKNCTLHAFDDNCVFQTEMCLSNGNGPDYLLVIQSIYMHYSFHMMSSEKGCCNLRCCACSTLSPKS